MEADVVSAGEMQFDGDGTGSNVTLSIGRGPRHRLGGLGILPLKPSINLRHRLSRSHLASNIRLFHTSLYAYESNVGISRTYLVQSTDDRTPRTHRQAAGKFPQFHVPTARPTGKDAAARASAHTI